MVNRNTGQRLKRNEAKKVSTEKLNKMVSDKHMIMSVKSNCNSMEFLDSQIDAIEKAVIKEVKLRYPFERLLTVSGIDNILGTTIMLVTPNSI